MKALSKIGFGNRLRASQSELHLRSMEPVVEKSNKGHVRIK
jgi:hypothetical protein